MATVDISDIRQLSGGALDIKAEILKALPKEVAGVAIWTDENNRLFGEHSLRKEYYPFHREKEILEDHGKEICSKIPNDSVVIELGSGVLRKTKLILSELERQEKNISYFAVDVAPEEMETQLGLLDKELIPREHIKIAGLWGTYDDCANWVHKSYPSHLPKSITFLFLGSTAGNVYPPETSAFLKKFAAATTAVGCDCRFLFTLDGATNIQDIELAYSNLPGLNARHKFGYNSLKAINNAFGHQVFNPDDWIDEIEFSKEDLMLQLYMRCLRDLTVLVGDKGFVYHKGDRLLFQVSAKFPESRVRDIVKNGGMRLAHVWQDRTNQYGFYLCVPDQQGNKSLDPVEQRQAIDGTVAV